MEAVNGITRVLLDRVNVCVAGTGASASVWQIDGNSRLTLVINTWGSLTVGAISHCCWSMGYNVEDVRISCMAGHDESLPTVVIFTLVSL